MPKKPAKPPLFTAMPGDRVREIRKALNLSQTELGAKLGLRGESAMKARTIRRWELGQRGVDGPTALALRFLLKSNGRLPPD